ncbi:baseplate J/gp47 family protein [uncultured Microscilla sp.]|uniref:baseplate J/gp47 family protein n=1 Tax=uncultured Microscilla sp. TaxID=432653 RepID=UPI00261CD547|nr:baseplate J/gp47 family protein [uncultured Microscilla sp.]
MTRTITQIENEILEAKEQDAVLQEINTASRFSPWRAIVYIMAFVIYSLEKLFTLFKADVTEIVTNNRIGSLAWYAQVSQGFQLGDNLNENLQYNTLNTDLQIISRVAVKELPDSTLSIKVAKGATQADLAPLTETEEQQFTAYLNKMKPAGVKVNAQSLTADQIKIAAEVFYNPLFASADITTRLVAAINDYCSNINFGGQLNRNDLIERVRQEEGIEDFVISLLQVVQNNATVDVSRAQELEAGYAVFDAQQSAFTYTPV